MNWSESTKLFLIFWIAVLVVYDVIAVLCGGREAAMSVVILEAAEKYPVIPFGFGFVFGHLFWKV